MKTRRKGRKGAAGLLRAASREKHFPAQVSKWGKALVTHSGDFSSVNELYGHG